MSISRLIALFWLFFVCGSVGASEDVVSRFQLKSITKQKFVRVELFEEKDHHFHLDGHVLAPEIVGAYAAKLASWRGKAPQKSTPCYGGTYEFSSLWEGQNHFERGCLGSPRYVELARGFDALR